MNKIKEKILVIKARQGDAEAFRKIYQELVDRIYRFIFYRLPNKEDSQEILQETFLNLWKFITDPEKEITHLQALTYKIAKNLIANFYSRRKETFNLEDVEYKLSGSGDLSVQIDLKIGIKQVLKKLEKLNNQDYKEVVEMKFLDDLSHKEIAKILDKSEENIRQLLSRAIKKIKSEINE